jgi:Transglycosylase SLT domain
LGDAAMALAPIGLADGGRVGYDDGGPIDDIFNRGIIGAESAGRQFDRYGRTLTSPKGAEGISQIMPGTAPEAARLAGLPYDPARVRSDEAYNKALGRAYYNEQLRKFGTPELAAAAYNAGPGRLQSALRQAQATGRDVMSFLPAETQAYVPKVMGRGVTAPGGGLDQARAELMASRRAIPLGDPRRRMMALDQSSGVVPASSTPPSTSGVSAGAAKEGGLGGLLTEQNVIPALMGIGKGISGMMSAKTVSPGAAIAAGLGEGLAGGAESYLGTQKTLADVENIKQQAAERAELAKRAAAETRTEGARTGQVEALTKQIGAGTEKIYAEIAGNSVKEVNGITYIKYIDPKTGAYRMMNIGEWNALDPSERPSIDPRLVSIAQEVEAKKLASGAPSGGGAPAAGGAPRAPSGVMPEAPKVTPTSTTSVPEEVGKYAQSVAISKSGLSREGRAQVPDLFSPQIELARNAEEQKNNLLPLVGALAALPAEKSIMTSGKQQEFINPLVNYLAGIARTFGQEEFFLNKMRANPQMLADATEVKKLVNQMQQTATQNNQLHAFGAFKEMAEGIPSLLISPGAQRQLAAQLLVANQRQIDKNNIFTDWRRQAAGPRGANAEFARLTSPEANKFFDDTYSNAFYAPDRENIAKIFTVPVPVKGGGTRSLAEVLAKYPHKLTPEYKEYLNKEYPGVLRHFGIR